MADLTQTAANVGLSGSNATLRLVQVGEAVTQGQPGYLSSEKYYQTDASASASAAAAGVFLTPAATDGYAVFATAGDIDLGATLTVGAVYVVSATKGAIAPLADLTTGEYVTTLGVATAADTLALNIDVSGVAVP